MSAAGRRRFRPRLWPSLITATMLATLLAMGSWQLERLEWKRGLIAEMTERKVAMVVVHGFPPGASGFLSGAQLAGIGTGVVLHSSMAQHGAEAGEAAVTEQVLRLGVDRVGFVKAGLAESFAALGYPAFYVPNRAPELPDVRSQDLGPGHHIGVFAEPFWRKNVVTQLGAVALLDDATAHAMRRPDVGYLDDLRIVEHGEMPWETFLSLQASMDLNLYVTLSECQPLTPVESYLSGVPALSTTSTSLTPTLRRNRSTRRRSGSGRR